MIADLLKKRTLLYAVVGVFIGCIIGSFALLIFIEAEGTKLQNQIYPHVSIDGKDVGRLTKDEANKLFQHTNEQLKSVQISVIYKDEQIATLSAETINLRSDASETVDKAYLIGRTPHIPTQIKQRIFSLVGTWKHPFNTSIIYDIDKVEDFLALQKENYNVPAKNALFEFQDGKVTSFKPDEKGVEIDSEKFKKDLHEIVASLKNKPGNKKVILTANVLQPEITLAQANKFGIEEEIGVGKSDYSHSIPGRVHNVILAASRFHGVLIPKDSVFSFNEIIGDISANTGYQPAYIIKNGKTVLGDGGGVCQVSTTIFRAALNTGLPIEERNAHAYRVTYYENDSKPGFDATIFHPTVDLKFKNDTPSSILIQTEIDKDNNLLTFHFYGQKDNRTVTLSEPLLWDVAPPPAPLMQDDPTLPKGETRQVDWAAWGGKAKFTYKVSKPDGQVYEKEFYSSYRPWQAVFLVGTAG